MKKTIVALACCALFAPLAFAQTKTTTTTETITITGRIVTESEEGRRQIINRPEPLLFARTNRINRAAMFSTGVVTLWTNEETQSKRR